MFNSRQLLVHVGSPAFGCTEAMSPRRFVIRALVHIQQYLRNQNGFVFWNPQRDTPEPFFRIRIMRQRLNLLKTVCLEYLDEAIGLAQSKESTKV